MDYLFVGRVSENATETGAAIINLFYHMLSFQQLNKIVVGSEFVYTLTELIFVNPDRPKNWFNGCVNSIKLNPTEADLFEFLLLAREKDICVKVLPIILLHVDK